MEKSTRAVLRGGGGGNIAPLTRPWKKGQTYGTLLVELELGRCIDLLPDRREETLETWLRTHPEIEVMSRDRGGEYAAAARKGAPQAQQVADKFHLVKTLREGLKDFLARKQKSLPEVEEMACDGIALRARGKRPEGATSAMPKPEPQEKHWRAMTPEPRHAISEPTSQSSAPSGSQVSRAHRAARYEAVRALQQQAVSQREIARRLHLARNTVRRFLHAESFPERSRPPYRGSILDPYKPYILDRWKAGCWNGTQLYQEVKGLGYTGSESLFRLFISRVRKSHQARGTSTGLTLGLDGTTVDGPAAPPSPFSLKRRLSPARASWLYVNHASQLDEKQRQQVEYICGRHTDLDLAYRLTQAFVSMLADHRDADLESWLAQVEHSGIRELKSFASGIRRARRPHRGAMGLLKHRSTA